MSPPRPSPLRIQQALTALLILFLLAGAVRGLGEGYSYWSDELWSVSASRADWGVMLRDWLLPDTHPPLYQALLKLWIALAGSGESATRSLSVLMAAASLVAMALFSSGRGAGRRLVSVAFLGTSPAFLFYSQETRSYATSLAFSAVMLGAALQLRQRALAALPRRPPPDRTETSLRDLFVLSCLLLSLTHYLSALFVLVVLAAATAEGLILRRRRQALPLLAALLAWPLVHLLGSSFSNKLERLDWIRVTPISGTLSEFLAGTLPLLIPARVGPAGWLLIATALATAVVFAVTAWRCRPPLPAPPGPEAGEVRFLLLVIAAFLGVMVALDPIKPLSQARYFIVVLPALAWLSGDGWELSRRCGRARRGALAAMVAVALLLQWQIGVRELARKRTPLQDYKAMAAFVTRSGVCREGCWGHGWPLETLSPLYFPPDSLRPWPGGPQAAAFPLTRPFLGFHGARDALPKLRAANPAFACWEAPGAWRTAPFLLLPPTSRAQPALAGLRPCPP
ncbi:MAG: hypothetical protein ER33_03375 [Cyanobium sp. CACIAM 14]|nr:MAG: hypothetical protein ER33_03375 [Cyanobium sp. CACIAM 14]